MCGEQFNACIAALDIVTATFRDARQGLDAPRYEADYAAFKLMQQAWLHVNAFSHVAAIPYTGSHLIAGWALLRAAYEAGLRALWLVKDDDWKEREARWLGWMHAEEDYWLRLAKDFRATAPGYAGELESYARTLRNRREEITKMLPKDSRPAPPSIAQMIADVGLEPQYYIPYRVACDALHGGPGSWRLAMKEADGRLHFLSAVTAREWAQPFRIASWCVAQPGIAVLLRAGAPAARCNDLARAHMEMLAAADALAECHPAG